MTPTTYGPEAYDSLYLNDDRSYEDPKASKYYPLFRRVADIATLAPITSILEVGCGSGVQAEMLLKAGITYHGFDFNPIAIAKAQARNGAIHHFVGDATNPDFYIDEYDGIVCCEVLEHIERDLQAIELWKPGALCICSVPNFDYPTHVRTFRSEAEVRARYGQLIAIEWIERISVSPSAGLTWGRYFRRLRWARNEPKKLLGMLGIRRFDWYGGWFVFVGRRKSDV
jgi:2-polyprenyl-3-methyl-5-hydroxy-6-metoxy-1,4-benzoquinol methylase